jgi:hypothetical protein
MEMNPEFPQIAFCLNSLHSRFDMQNKYPTLYPLIGNLYNGKKSLKITYRHFFRDGHVIFQQIWSMLRILRRLLRTYPIIPKI